MIFFGKWRSSCYLNIIIDYFTITFKFPPTFCLNLLKTNKLNNGVSLFSFIASTFALKAILNNKLTKNPPLDTFSKAPFLIVSKILGTPMKTVGLTAFKSPTGFAPSSVKVLFLIFFLPWISVRYFSSYYQK
jgi:hypothetical protein